MRLLMAAVLAKPPRYVRSTQRLMRMLRLANQSKNSMKDIRMRKSALPVIIATCLTLNSGAEAQSLSTMTEVDDPGLVFDERGRSNELIVRLNYSNTTNLPGLLSAGSASTGRDPRAAMENALIAAVQRRDRSIDLALGHPVAAGHLKQHSRRGGGDHDEATQDSASEQLAQYLVLRYRSVEAALIARDALKKNPGMKSVTNSMKALPSWSPNDPYYQPYAVWGPSPWGEAPPLRQWGLNVMKFAEAWDKSRGFSHVGIIDGGYPGVVTKPAGVADLEATHLGVALHEDVRNNYRQHFDPGPIYGAFAHVRPDAWHATHVSGIIAAEAGNGVGVAGGCPSCSLTAFPMASTGNWASAAQLAVDTGMQILNWSGELYGDEGHTSYNCSNQPEVCSVIQLLKERDVLLVQASGNFRKTRPPFPSNLPASDTTALPVGGTAVSSPMMLDWGLRPGSLWDYGDGMNGSSWPGVDGVLGPAKSVVSTVPRYSPAWDYLTAPYAMCGDSYALVNGVVIGADESGSRFPSGSGDGYGSCTGTSMAAPHITALAALVRSINPLLPASSVRTIIQNSGNRSASRTNELGSGLPNALTAVNAAIATNPSRLSPLFSFYSADRSDSFYTTVPQMAAAAIKGTLKPYVVCTSGMPYCTTLPKYASSYGVGITGHGTSGGPYLNFPGITGAVFGGSADRTPKAEVWVFTTHENPLNPSIPLVPLYRLSWKCDDSPVYQRPAICSYNASHTDTTYTADPAGVTAFQELGYKLDGIEGYIYPKTMPQPTGTVRLMRKYNQDRDDHAIFPETKLGSMEAQGYTADTGSDWMGYVYPNAGPVPSIL
ncbi:S8 family serine peptidase [Archangium gephyra]|nr:S8 family serine peptidase [Archangium gephyra]